MTCCVMKQVVISGIIFRYYLDVSRYSFFVLKVVHGVVSMGRWIRVRRVVGGRERVPLPGVPKASATCIQIRAATRVVDDLCRCLASDINEERAIHVAVATVRRRSSVIYAFVVFRQV